MAVVSNSGLNYTLYYNVLEYFKTIMTNHPSIAQVSTGDKFGIDDVEYPYYPLGNVLITEATFGTNVTEYAIQLTIADKVKLKNNESSGSRNNLTVPYLGVDDVVDIHANTLAILNDLTSYTQRSQQAFQINSDITCTPFKDSFDNGLAGWVSNFTLTTHNNKNMCLFDLNPQTSTTTIAPGPTTTTTAGPTTTTTTLEPTTTTTSTTSTTTAGPTTTTTTRPTTTTTSTTTTSTTSTTTSTTSTTTAAPTTTTTTRPTTTTASPTTTTTTTPGACNNAEFAVMQSGGNTSWATLGEACSALTGTLSTSFGGLWLSGTNLNSSTGCLQTNGGTYPLYTTPTLTTPATYTPVHPYVIMLNITYGSSTADSYVVQVTNPGGNTNITQQVC